MQVLYFCLTIMMCNIVDVQQTKQPSSIIDKIIGAAEYGVG